ncbi:MAG: hypothetical protein ACRCY8_14590, partial [Dermatophilaceae bacterium]
ARLHRPVSAGGATLLLVEPTGTVTTGDFAGDVPEHIDSTTGHRLAEPDGAPSVVAHGTRTATG